MSAVPPVALTVTLVELVTLQPVALVTITRSVAVPLVLAAVQVMFALAAPEVSVPAPVTVQAYAAPTPASGTEAALTELTQTGLETVMVALGSELIVTVLVQVLLHPLASVIVFVKVNEAPVPAVTFTVGPVAEPTIVPPAETVQL